MTDRSRDRKDLQAAIGYTFRDGALLRAALTHSSYAHERREAAGGDNERLEFLGDAVIGLAAARYLCEQFPEAEEGELTRTRAVLVREKWLAAAAGRLGLGDFLLLGKGEEKMGGRSKPSILSGAVEAVAGAVFLDGGWEAAYDLVTLLFRDAPATGEIDLRAGDAKTGLQELCQKHCRLEPHYRVLSQSGPAHRPSFRVAALLGEEVLAEGSGTSKQKAEQNAAASAIDLIESTGGLRCPGDGAEEDERPEA